MKFIFLFFFISTSCFAGFRSVIKYSEIIPEIIERVNSLRKEGKISKNGLVLAGFDLDNTAFTTVEKFGSDHWFDWQHNYILKNSRSKFRVVKKFEELLELYLKAVGLLETRLVDKDLLHYLKLLKDNDIKIFALTARGEDIIPATIAALNKNKLDFSNSAFDEDSVEKVILRNGSEGKVHLRDGVIYAGQAGGPSHHKGKTLDAFLDGFGLKPEYLAFFDDKDKNLLTIEESMMKRKIIFEAYRADMELEGLKKFLARGANASKREAHEGYLKFLQSPPCHVILNQ